MTAVEDPTKWRRHRPPYWCTSCEIGQSIPNCWLCGQQLGLTTRGGQLPDGNWLYPPGSQAARAIPSAGLWKPDE